mmetsp:Transcript_8692/g.13413  ORF Transcript_8692/g.13413 Transcript_8692/m.13413 type:complete len:201 (-) Transcript_8692:487-1089(-)
MQDRADISRVARGRRRQHIMHHSAEFDQFSVVHVSPILLNRQSVKLKALEIERDVVHHNETRIVATQQRQIFKVATISATRAVIAKQNIAPQRLLRCCCTNLVLDLTLDCLHQRRVHAAHRRRPQNNVELFVRRHLLEEGTQTVTKAHQIHVVVHEIGLAKLAVRIVTIVVVGEHRKIVVVQTTNLNRLAVDAHHRHLRG